MKTNRIVLIYGLVIVAVIATATIIAVGLSQNPKSPHKNDGILYLTAADTGLTKSIKKGSTINLTLQDYGDGGYVWNITTIDSHILSLTNCSDWGRTGQLGDFGHNTWLFTAMNTGTTTLKLECRRPWAGGDISQTLTFTLDVI